MILMISNSFRRGAVALGIAVLTITTGCSAPAGDDDSATSIVVGAYPFEFVATRVAGDHATVTNLLAPGSDGHDLELSPQQVAAVSNADLVLYQSGYQAALDEAVEQQSPANVLDTASFLTLRTAAEDDDHDADDADDDHEADEHGGYDPHVWLDPTNVAEIADHTAQLLSQLQPENADAFTANAQQLRSELTSLDADFASGLANCRTNTFITSHTAFGYLAARYGLDQVGISGLSPEEEPSPARIAQVQQIATERDVTTIFYETAVSPKVSQAIASDLGLATDVLDPIETLSSDSRGSDYIEVMN
ncbi:MAG: zinc ABC transporter substrate-binding protein, partial [Propionibacteriaceae bacterium]|nr:zinc ABC transporter substrate-binding protein [Propionibacteriaceae bacterium]